jgi:TRAP-type C4-dicarboxylate transport system permease small subunit
MDCPRCGLINPPIALRCDCGHDFQQPLDAKRPMPPETPIASTIQPTISGTPSLDLKSGVLRTSKKSGEDLLVGLCGFITSLLTAIVLWWVESRFGFAFYSLTYWFILPIGALLSGFAGASGYYAGSWLFGHRPSRLLLLNATIASVATFLLIHYLSYITVQIEGKQISDYISFSQYLDLSLTSTSMEFRLRAMKVGSTGQLGSFGYIVAVLQILGFAAGGFAVYGHLASKPYCEKCARYLSGKGKQMRYGDSDAIQANTASVFSYLHSGAAGLAIDQQSRFGSSVQQRGNYLRSVFEVRYCKKCNQHWVKFTVEKQKGNNWNEISELTVRGFVDGIVSVSKS